MGQQAKDMTVAAAFMAAHVELHPAGAEMQDLLARGVRHDTVLALYPFDFADWHAALRDRFQWEAVRGNFIRMLTTGSTSNRWLDIVTIAVGEHGESIVQRAEQAYFQKRECEELSAVLTPQPLMSTERYLVEISLRHTVEILTVAADWTLFTELHGDWQVDYEAVLGRVLRGLGQATQLGAEVDERMIATLAAEQ